MMSGRDMIGQAQSGTGKTATYILGALALIDFHRRCCQSLILVPTRELARQIQIFVLALGAYLQIQCHACIGSNRVRDDVQKLRNGQHVVVGTCGPVCDMLRRRCLRADDLKVLVLDEADEMLSRGFKDQIYNIFRALPPEVQVCLFSATMPNEILELSTKLMRNPLCVFGEADELTLEGIRQFYVKIEKEDWKLDTLCDLHKTQTITRAIIFCNYRQKMEFLANELAKRDFTVSIMHADLDQKECDLILWKFGYDSSHVIISTDPLACRINVQKVSLVINYDFPETMENYLHRIGRNGIFRQKGAAINFVTNQDVQMMKDVERQFHTQIEEMPMDIKNMI